MIGDRAPRGISNRPDPGGGGGSDATKMPLAGGAFTGPVVLDDVTAGVHAQFDLSDSDGDFDTPSGDNRFHGATNVFDAGATFGGNVKANVIQSDRGGSAGVVQAFDSQNSSIDGVTMVGGSGGNGYLRYGDGIGNDDVSLYRSGAAELTVGSGANSGAESLVAKAVKIGTATTKPTADASQRGRFYTELGGAGVADVTYQCLKSAGDTYSWKTVATG